jgi:import receptor subunit TOM22
MVKVEIVQDQDEVNNSPYASNASSRTGSSASLSSVESELGDESLYDRLTALKDIVPPSTRHSISSTVSSTASFFKKGGKILGNIVWVVTTSALLVGLPLALSLEDEAKIVAQEKEMLAQQQGAQQVRPLNSTRFSCLLKPSVQMLGGSSLYPQPGSEQQPKGIVPPGF